MKLMHCFSFPDGFCKSRKIFWNFKHVYIGLILLVGCCIPVTALASSSTWDQSQNLFLVRGVSIVNSGISSTYYLVLGNLDTSQGTLILEVLEIANDTIPGEAQFTPVDNLLNFEIDVDGYTYKLWMQLIQGNSSKLFLVLQRYDSYPNSTGETYTTSSLNGCFSPDNSSWLSYYCFDGNGNWYEESWNVISGCSGALENGSYQIQGSNLTMCDSTGCDSHTMQMKANGIIIDGDSYSTSNGCN